VASTLADAEEAHLVWQWLTSGTVRLIDADRPLSEPRDPVGNLEAITV
jgi:hypothetical protein